MRTALVVVALILLAPVAADAHPLNASQLRATAAANDTGRAYGVPLLAAMQMQESSGCQNRIDNGDSLGCLQVRPGTAREVLKYCADHRPACRWLSFSGTDAELKQRLKHDPAFTRAIGAIYFKLCIKTAKGDTLRALALYNCGRHAKKIPAAAWAHADRVMKWQHKLERWRLV